MQDRNAILVVGKTDYFLAPAAYAWLDALQNQVNLQLCPLECHQPTRLSKGLFEEVVLEHPHYAAINLEELSGRHFGVIVCEDESLREACKEVTADRWETLPFDAPSPELETEDRQAAATELRNLFRQVREWSYRLLKEMALRPNLEKRPWMDFDPADPEQCRRTLTEIQGRLVDEPERASRASYVAQYLFDDYPTPWDRIMQLVESCAGHGMLQELEEHVRFMIEQPKRMEIVEFRYDEQYRAGTFAIEALAAGSTDYVPLLIAYLRAGQDPDHDPRHTPLINRVLQTHGWSEDTYPLACAACFKYTDQNWTYTLEDWCKFDGLAQWLRDNDKADAFVQELSDHLSDEDELHELADLIYQEDQGNATESVDAHEQRIKDELDRRTSEAHRENALLLIEDPVEASEDWQRVPTDNLDLSSVVCLGFGVDVRGVSDSRKTSAWLELRRGGQINRVVAESKSNDTVTENDDWLLLMPDWRGSLEARFGFERSGSPADHIIIVVVELFPK
ncbi:MAG: hypothetical protein AAGK09_11545 [Planctomycetota bacterium]